MHMLANIPSEVPAISKNGLPPFIISTAYKEMNNAEMMVSPMHHAAYKGLLRLYLLRMIYMTARLRLIDPRTMQKMMVRLNV